MKPLGVGFTVKESEIGMGVVFPSRVEDAVWDAVEIAMDAGWTAKQFQSEACEAWQRRIRDDASDAAKDADKAFDS